MEIPSRPTEDREELAAGPGAVHAEAPVGARAALLRLDLLQPVRGDGAALAPRPDAVEMGGVLSENSFLDGTGQCRVAELLLHRGRDLERLEGIDEPLRGAPPDRVRAPEDVPRAERAEELAEEMSGLVRSLEQGHG